MISLVDAGPGTGKTFTLVYTGLKAIKSVVGTIEFTDEQQTIIDYVLSEFKYVGRYPTIAYFTHSNTNKDILIKRLGSQRIKVFTFHGAGRSVIQKRFGYQKLVKNRTESHIQQVTGLDLKDMTWPDKRKWYTIKRLVALFKTEDLAPSPENLSYLVTKYHELAKDTISVDYLSEIEDLLGRASRPDGEIDYADMPWMGKKVAQITPESRKYDIGFVDESQDVFMSAYQLVISMCKNVVFCGDRNQAINAFAGASEVIYDRIESRSDAVLPLKVTQRCPLHICNKANLIRPGGIIHGPNTLEGEEDTWALASLPEKLRNPGVYPENTLIVSRTNATVIGTALFLYKNKIPSKIVDKDLETELLRFISNFKTQVLTKLVAGLNRYKDTAARSRNPLWEQICKDKADTVLALIKECETFTELKQLIGITFEEKKGGFPMTTLHKAKGSEADNIIILSPPIELSIARDHPIQWEQEVNLHFVGLTRSSKNLYWVK